MRSYCFILIIAMSFLSNIIFAQSFFDGIFKEYAITYNDKPITYYDFCTKDTKHYSKLKVEYLAKDAYSSFIDLNSKKEVLLLTSASFTSAVFWNGYPIGICAVDGEILNKMPDPNMDALLVFDKNGLINDLVVYDLDWQSTDCSGYDCENHNFHLNPRDNVLDTYPFFKWIHETKRSVFQTQLLYSKNKSLSENFQNLKIGSCDRERRFFVLAMKDSKRHYLIVNYNTEDYLLNSAKESYQALKEQNFDVEFILNLDVGSRNILHTNTTGNELINQMPNPDGYFSKLEKAASLMVFYYDK